MHPIPLLPLPPATPAPSYPHTRPHTHAHTPLNSRYRSRLTPPCPCPMLPPAPATMPAPSHACPCYPLPYTRNPIAPRPPCPRPHAAPRPHVQPAPACYPLPLLRARPPCSPPHAPPAQHTRRAHRSLAWLIHSPPAPATPCPTYPAPMLRMCNGLEVAPSTHAPSWPPSTHAPHGVYMALTIGLHCSREQTVKRARMTSETESTGQGQTPLYGLPRADSGHWECIPTFTTYLCPTMAGRKPLPRLHSGRNKLSITVWH